MKKVATVIVTYNRLGLLKECIDSLKKQSYTDHSIIVINNGSTDTTGEWLKYQSDLITITQENTGGAGGFFTGIKYACEHGYEYSWVMDDDVIADPDALKSLMDNIACTNGFICSKVVDPDGNHCNVPRLSQSKSPDTGELLWGNMLGRNLLRVDIASFVSVLIKNSSVYELGLPYKEYFIWGDDTEYTNRISSRYPSYMAFNSIVVHKRKINSILSIRTETDSNRIKNYFYAYRNRIHCRKGVLHKTAVFAYSFFEALRLIASGRFYPACVVLKGIFCAITFNPTIMYPDKCWNR